MAELEPLRAVIERHGLWTKKSLGQNFLLDRNLLDRIARVPGDLCGAQVYEVGPGPGGLTGACLLRGAAHITAVEKDSRCIAALAELEQQFPGRLTVRNEDALALDENTLAGPLHVLANLPYNVGTALLVRWLTTPQWPPWWSSLTLMFQKEVAERIVAAPGSSAYGRLAVLAQWRARPRIAFAVPARAFLPPPKVDSAVVHLVPSAPLLDIPLKALEQVTAAAFNQRRKMLRASLKALGGDPLALIAAAGLDEAQRAETVDVAGYCRLAKALAER
jgi:16S rRNA (adenine1518-N6/adenine1519-N6)-dimethyltransferase